MLKIAIGHSDEIDSEDAILEILKQCHEEFGETTAQAGILYSSIDHEFDIFLDNINKAHPDIELIGYRQHWIKLSPPWD